MNYEKIIEIQKKIGGHMYRVEVDDGKDVVVVVSNYQTLRDSSDYYGCEPLVPTPWKDIDTLLEEYGYLTDGKQPVGKDELYAACLKDAKEKLEKTHAEYPPETHFAIIPEGYKVSFVLDNQGRVQNAWAEIMYWWNSELNIKEHPEGLYDSLSRKQISEKHAQDLYDCIEMMQKYYIYKDCLESHPWMFDKKNFKTFLKEMIKKEESLHD